MNRGTRIRPARLHLWGVFIGLTLTGCRSLILPPRDGVKLTTPSINAPKGHCSTAALMFLLRQYQIPCTQEELDSKLYIPAINGTLAAVIVDVANEYNLPLTTQSGTWERVRQLVYDRRPPLLVLAPTRHQRNGHIIAISGAGRSGHKFRITDSNGHSRWVHARSLTAAWDTAQRVMLVPPSPP